MNKLEDHKLKKLLREMKLDSPKADFSDSVMNIIRQEEKVLEKIKSQKILGKSFWIILGLFVVLFAIIFAMPDTSLSGESQIFNTLFDSSTNIISTGYHSLFKKM